MAFTYPLDELVRRRLLIGISVLFFFVFPTGVLAQDVPESGNQPASIFTQIKTQVKKDIQTLQDVTKKEGRKSARRTKKESRQFRGTIREMKGGPNVGMPGPVLSDR